MGKNEVDLQHYSYLFLDRDGTINRRIKDGYVTSWEGFYFLPGALESLYHFSKHFEKIIIVTNQQGIGKGLMTHEELKVIHEHMLKEVMQSGGRIDEIYYCPHLEAFNPWCRKPRPGMVEQAKKDFPEIDFHRSIMIGDSIADVELGKNMGMLTVKILNKEDKLKEEKEADIFVSSLLEFCQLYLLEHN